MKALKGNGQPKGTRKRKQQRLSRSGRKRRHQAIARRKAREKIVEEAESHTLDSSDVILKFLQTLMGIILEGSRKRVEKRVLSAEHIELDDKRIANAISFLKDPSLALLKYCNRADVRKHFPRTRREAAQRLPQFLPYTVARLDRQYEKVMAAELSMLTRDDENLILQRLGHSIPANGKVTREFLHLAFAVGLRFRDAQLERVGNGPGKKSMVRDGSLAINGILTLAKSLKTT